MSHTIRIAHSPDSDDFFLFWAIVEQRIPCDGYAFEFVQHDTQSLNVLASEAEYDVTAISVGAYPALSERYAILTSGASVGRNYGPVLAAKQKLVLEDLANATIAIPGETTTAARVLRRIVPDATFATVPITPFEGVFDALSRGDVQAVLLIHEGQLGYEKYHLHKVLDIGEWWHRETSLPLPLGINVIRKELGEHCAPVARILEDSIRYALANKEETLAALAERNRQRGATATTDDEVATYLSRYANEDSVNLDSDCRAAIALLLEREIERGMIEYV